MDQQTNISKTPPPILIIAQLLIATGIIAIIGFVVIDVLTIINTTDFSSGSLINLLLMAVPIVMAIVIVFAGIGLRKMKKSSLYLLVLVTVFSIVEPIRNVLVGVWSYEIFIIFIVTIGITLYCWNKKSLFS